MSVGRFSGKVAVVTGAATGIGRAIALRLAREGAKVTISDINQTESAETIRLIKSIGGDAAFVRADSSDENDIMSLLKQSRATFGPVDILVNNAAAFWFGNLREVKRDNWIRLYETNVVGYANAIKYALPDFEVNKKGIVVNIASVSSYIAQPDMFVYNAVKGGVGQLTRCLALDLAKENVRVNAICPGAVFTPASANHMKYLGLSIEEGKKAFASDNPMKRMATPEEIAGPVAFLASDDASFITGHLLVVDGGATID